MGEEKLQALRIGDIPAAIYGAKSERVYVYVHGMMGRKEDSEPFAEIAEASGFQVLSFDLIGHGERERVSTPDPFNTLPEIEAVYDFARSRWGSISLYAVSIGAWFSLTFFQGRTLGKSLLVSPVVNMKLLIERMMTNAGVTPEILRDRKVIPDANLSWEYYDFAVKNQVTRWDTETEILYPERNNITPRSEIEEFAGKFGCGLTVLPDAEHWIHEADGVKFLRDWERDTILR
ncbi:MAG: alpha/beta hydrolase [Synergistaceae bacterium]|nr:alpha/beta hydrolase [Synergistaceae bacterium]